MSAVSQQNLQQAQQHKLFTGDGHIRAPGIVRIAAEDTPRLVADLGAARDDERAVCRIDRANIAKHGLARRSVNLHAGDHKEVGHATIEPHLRGAEVAIPLLEDNAGFAEANVRHSRTDGANARWRHAQVGVYERQHAGAVIEGAGDHAGQIMACGQAAQALTQGQEFAGPQQFIASFATRKFHGQSLLSATVRRVRRGLVSRLATSSVNLVIVRRTS